MRRDRFLERYDARRPCSVDVATAALILDLPADLVRVLIPQMTLHDQYYDRVDIGTVGDLARLMSPPDDRQPRRTVTVGRETVTLIHDEGAP